VFTGGRHDTDGAGNHPAGTPLAAEGARLRAGREETGVAWISEALESLASLPRPVVIAAAGALALGECTLGLGFVVPGESGLLVASATVTDRQTFLVMCAVVAVCAAVGDTIGYLLGRRYGPALRESRVVRRVGQNHWDRAGKLLCRNGGRAVFTARFLPVVRTLMPAAAGASGLTYRRFLPASLVGAFSWSALHIGIGAAAGASARYIEKMLGTASWIVMGLLVVVGVSVVLVRRRRTARAAARAEAGGDPEPELEVTR